MSDMKRYLAFVTFPYNSLVDHLKGEGCVDIIVRKFTYGTEVDFHCMNDEIISALSSRYAFQRLREFDEEADSFRPEKRQSFLDREDEIVGEANELITQERYWESHTVLENLWKSHEGPRKEYYQGIILVSASMTQHQMGKPDAAISLYGRARSLLQDSGIGGHILSQIPDEFSYPVFFTI